MDVQISRLERMLQEQVPDKAAEKTSSKPCDRIGNTPRAERIVKAEMTGGAEEKMSKKARPFHAK